MQFSAVASAITAGAARDLLALVCPAGKRLRIRLVVVTPDATAGAEHFPFELYTAAASAVSAGTAVTVRCMEAYEPTPAAASYFNGTCASLPTVSAKLPTQPLWREAQPFSNGFRWAEDQGVRELWIGAAEALVIRQAGTTAVASSVSVHFDEVD